MICVHTFGNGRHKRQADITLFFEYTSILSERQSFQGYKYKYTLSVHVLLNLLKINNASLDKHFIPFSKRV